MSLRIIFFGNTKYSRLGAKIIHENSGISAVITIPDRPNKKGIFIPSPTKEFALVQNIPVLTMNKLDDEAIHYVASLKPDFFIVEDYGLILPDKILSLPKYVSLNIHHSLLPKYRGPAPAPAAILAGEKTSGVTVIRITKKVDAGDILAQKEYALTPRETTDSLLSRLNILGAYLVILVINNYLKGSIQTQKQDESKATYTKMLTRQDGYFDIDNPPSKNQLDRMIRAYYPWPGVWSKIRIRDQKSGVRFLPEEKIQVEGGKPMNIKDFFNGYPEMRETLKGIFHE